MASQALLRGATVLRPDGTLGAADVLIDDGKISDVRPNIPAAAQIIALEGLTLVPGFIDVHVHGGGGFDLAAADAGQLTAYARWVVSRGVTSFLATVCAGSVDGGLAAGAALAATPATRGAELLDVNFEGPFVSPERPGALPRGWLAPPSVETFRRIEEACRGRLRVMTVAPELPGAAALIEAAAAAGVRVSVGHTDATFAEAKAAFERGASHVTHAFNAMRPLHHRDPGPLGAALESPDVTVEVIADGVHLHPATVRLLVEAFGAHRICLITDGVTPAGLGSGAFRIGGQEAALSDGSIRLPDGTIAGSAATMDAVVANVVRWGVAGLAEAVRMASVVPARVAGADRRKGAIAPGFDADVVALDGDMRVVRTWVAGETVFGPGATVSD